MYLLGTVLIMCGVIAAAVASLSYALVIRGNAAALAAKAGGSQA